MPAVRAMDGCAGLSMLADSQTGSCIVTTSWRDEATLRSSVEDVRPFAERTAELLERSGMTRGNMRDSDRKVV